MKQEAQAKVTSFFTRELDGLAIVSESFNYDQCMDLIKLSPQSEDEETFWPVLLAIFAEKANKKSFFYGRRVGPTLADIDLILSKLRLQKEKVD